jgi:hypothetical protein
MKYFSLEIVKNVTHSCANATFDNLNIVYSTSFSYVVSAVGKAEGFLKGKLKKLKVIIFFKIYLCA